MIDQNISSSKARFCQAAGCKIDLKQLGKPYNLKKRLCPKHMQAEEITTEGSKGQWRFCQQCGKLEPLQQFEGIRRSCIIGLQRRRDSRDACAAAEKQQQQQQSCQAGNSLSGPSCQASTHHAIAGCQAGTHRSDLSSQASNNQSGPGFGATWNPSLAAAGTATHAVKYSSGDNRGSIQPVATTDLVLPSPSTRVTAAAEPATAAAATAHAPVHLSAEVPHTARLQGTAAAASHASDVWSQMQAPRQQPVGTPVGRQPAAATAAAVHTRTGMIQASLPDLEGCSAVAAPVPSSSLGCTGVDATDVAVLDEIEQQLLLTINMTQQQLQAAAGQLTPPAAGMPGSGQLTREISRAATVARLQELTRQFAVLQQALQDGLAADLDALQCGPTALQLQQQLAYSGVISGTSVQSYSHVWQI